MLDPQLRILLELSYEAIVDAGYNPAEFRGSRTGVFIGISVNESDEFWCKHPDKINGYGLIGCARSMIANRVSFCFDLTGKLFIIFYIK